MNEIERDRLLDQLLALKYDLLDDEEAAELRKRIAREPDVAELWQLTLRTSDALGQAAKVEAPEITFDRVRSTSQVEAWRRPLLVAAVAACLSWVALGWSFVSNSPDRPAGFIAINANFENDPEELGRTIKIQTRVRLVEGLSVTPASVSFAVVNQSLVLFRGVVDTDDEGIVQIKLPAGMIIPAETKLHVEAESVRGATANGSLEIPLPPTRCSTYVTTDRLIYAPGDTVFARSVTLTRGRHRADIEVPIRFSIRGDDGTMISVPMAEGLTKRGVGNAAFGLPKDLSPGKMTIEAESLDGLFPTERVTIEVRSIEAVTIDKQVKFDRRRYSLGDSVEATFQLSLADGSPPGGARATVVAMAEDSILHRASGTVSEDGAWSTSFVLPKTTPAESLSMSLTVSHGEITETRWFPIPLSRGEVQTHFYPEGGELVAGMVNRVYVETVDKGGAPVDVEADIVDGSGEVVTSVKTNRDGRAMFRITPLLDEEYRWLSGNETVLPPAVEDLPIIDTGSGVIESGQPIKFTLRTMRERMVSVQAVCRGELIGQRDVNLTIGDNEVSIVDSSDASGVIRLTVFDELANPVVERLVYRKSDAVLNVSMNPVAGGERSRFQIRVTDGNGNPRSAVLGVSVVQSDWVGQSNLSRVSLPTHFRLGSEIASPQTLEDADFYLSDAPESEIALDLLLGTQGWRRFAWRGESADLNANREELRSRLMKLLAMDEESYAGETFASDETLHRAEWDAYRQHWLALSRQTIVRGAVGATIIFLLMLLWGFKRQQTLANAAMTGLMIIAMPLFGGCGGSREITVIDTSTDYSIPPDARVETKPPGSPRGDDSPSAESLPPVEALMPQDDQETLELLQRLLPVLLEDNISSSQELTKQMLQDVMLRRGLTPNAMADELMGKIQFPIRQYAFRADTSPRSSDAVPATLFWHPLLIAGDDGHATVEFEWPEGVETIQWKVDAHDGGGYLGGLETTLRSR